MTNGVRPRKILLPALCVFSASMAVATIALSVMLLDMRVRIDFAKDQVEIFDQMVRQTRTSNVQDAEDELRYVQGYYPSGTKQKKGSRLDSIVETARTHAISLIEQELQRKNRAAK